MFAAPTGTVVVRSWGPGGAIKINIGLPLEGRGSGEGPGSCRIRGLMRCAVDASWCPRAAGGMATEGL